MRLHNVPLCHILLFLGVVNEGRGLIGQDVGIGEEIVMSWMLALHLGEVLQHEVFPSYFVRLGEVVDLHVGAQALVDCGSNHSYVPDNRAVVILGFDESVFLEQMLDQSHHAVCEFEFVAVVFDFVVKVAARPVLEQEVPDGGQLDHIRYNNRAI